MTDQEKGHLYLVPAENELLLHVASLYRGSFRDPDCQDLVILPTKRLQTFLLALWATKEKALHPPKMGTLEEFILDHAPKQAIASHELIQLTLKECLETHSNRHLHPDQVHEILVFFAELDGYGMFATGFQELERVLLEDIYKNEAHLGSLQERFSELAHLYTSLHAKLTSLKLVTRAKALFQGASWIAEHPKSLQDKISKLYVCGLTTTLPVWQKALKALSSTTTFILTDPKPDHPLKDFVDELKGLVPVTKVPRKALAKAKTASFTLKNPFLESFFVAQTLKGWIDQGVPASQLGVIVTDEATYGPPLRMALLSYDIKANLAIAQPFRQHMAGQLLESFAKFFLGEECLGFFSHPYLQAQFPIFAKLEFIKILDQKTPLTLDRVLSFAKEQGEADPFFEALREFSDLLQGLHPAFVYGEAIIACLEPLLKGQMDSKDPYAQGVQDAWQNFCLLKNHESTERFSLGAFWRVYKEFVLDFDIRLIGEPLAGVQVISLSESRHVPLASAIIVGCNEGLFPKGLPKDDVVDDYLKRAIGLPGWQHLEKIENLTFELLHRRIPTLWLTRSQLIDDLPQVRSRFIEELLVQEQATSHEPSFDIHTALPPKAGELSALELQKEGGWPEDPSVLIAYESATSLSHLQNCPYQYLLAKKGLRPFEPFDPLGDLREEGEWLHQVMEHFFERKEPLPPFYERQVWEAKAMQDLIRLTLRFAPKGIETTALYAHLLHWGFPKLLDHIATFMSLMSPPSFGTHWTEIAFDHENLVKVTIQKTQRLLKGSVDHFADYGSFCVVTDYKRSTLPSVREATSGLKPQLAVYYEAIRSLFPEKNRLLFGYYSLLDGKWLPIAVSSPFQEEALSHGLITKNTPLLSELEEDFHSAWHSREQEIRERGRFFAQVQDCNYCAFSGVCRRLEPGREDVFLKEYGDD